MEGTAASFGLVSELRGPNGQYIDCIREASGCEVSLQVGASSARHGFPPGTVSRAALFCSLSVA